MKFRGYLFKRYLQSIYQMLVLCCGYKEKQEIGEVYVQLGWCRQMNLDKVGNEYVCVGCRGWVRGKRNGKR